MIKITIEILLVICSNDIKFKSISLYLLISTFSDKFLFCFRITLAICDSDTTTVYYKITEGLMTPESPEVTEVKKVKRFELMRKHQLDVQRAIQTYKTAKLTDSASQDCKDKPTTRTSPS